jgi:hypothetical protein
MSVAGLGIIRMSIESEGFQNKQAALEGGNRGLQLGNPGFQLDNLVALALVS